ncbi:MAG: response regulator [Spirochaetes bacterium]|nr:response regulator [Spirochaetota bacterium]
MKKILLVDDQPNFTTMMSIKLKSMQFEVFTATNGQEGLDLALKEIPDLIIMDIMMPVMDGFTAVAELRKNPKTANVLVIFLSAKGNPKDRDRAQELKAIDFIAKPFSPRELVDKIQKLIG